MLEKSKLQGEDLEQEQDTDEPVKKSGGCGAQQPNITVDGMKMVAEFKTTKKKTDEIGPVRRRKLKKTDGSQTRANTWSNPGSVCRNSRYGSTCVNNVVK